MSLKQLGRQIQLFASAAVASASVITFKDLDSLGCRGVEVILDVTAYSAGGLTIAISGKDPMSGKYYPLLAAPTKAASTGTKVFVVYPGATAAAGTVASRAIPEVFNVTLTPDDATSITYSVGVNLLP